MFIDSERAAVRFECCYARFGLNNFKTVFRQLEIGYDIREQRTGGVGQCGTAETGMNLFSSCQTSQHFAAFQDECLQSCLRQIARRDESIMTATDNDDVVLFGHLVYSRFQSFSSCKAALRPGAPITPPPGCVAEPHM